MSTILVAPRRLYLLVALTGLALLSACGRNAATAGYTSQDGVIEQVAQPQREALPRITGRLIGGGRFDSSGLAGRVLVYNIWGFWCAPCRKEAPDLRRVSAETRARGVRFVGVDVKDEDTAAAAFMRRYRITYPSISTSDSGTALLTFAQSVPANAVPSTLVVDRNGRVAARILGAITYSTLTAMVEDVLTEPGVTK